MIQYRNNDLYGGGSTLITKVMRYEIFELGNKDILCYMNHYNNAFNDQTKTLMKKLINEEDMGFDDIEKQEIFCEDILHQLNVNMDKHLRYCLWLTDMQGMKEHYLDDYKNTEDATIESVISNISAYETGFILSDLGTEGKLYAYQEMPKEITDDDTREMIYTEYILTGQLIGPIAYITKTDPNVEIRLDDKIIKKEDILSNELFRNRTIKSVRKYAVTNIVITI